MCALAFDTRYRSPNFDDRGGVAVDILLLHYTGMKTGAEALERLVDPEAKVSAHYAVEEDGRIFRLVAERDRAWHAGAAYWAGHTDINARSIGIEIVNPGHEFGYRPFPAPQMDAVVALSRDIVRRHRIPADRVLGHSDVAPTRKEDPGELFDWPRLAAAGVGVWPTIDPADAQHAPSLMPGDSGPQVFHLQSALAAIGYDVQGTGTYDRGTEQVMIAFQRHFRPSSIDGIADPESLQILHALLRRNEAPLDGLGRRH